MRIVKRIQMTQYVTIFRSIAFQPSTQPGICHNCLIAHPEILLTKSWAAHLLVESWQRFWENHWYRDTGASRGSSHFERSTMSMFWLIYAEAKRHLSPSCFWGRSDQAAIKSAIQMQINVPGKTDRSQQPRSISRIQRFLHRDNENNAIYLLISMELQNSHCDTRPYKARSGVNFVGRSQYLEDSANQDLNFRLKIITLCEFSDQYGELPVTLPAIHIT
jgi:hypothetical protein